MYIYTHIQCTYWCVVFAHRFLQHVCTHTHIHTTLTFTHICSCTHTHAHTHSHNSHTHTEPQKQYDPAPHIVTIQHHHHRLWYASPGHRTPRSQPFPRPTRCPCSHFNSGKAHLCTQDGPRPTGFIWKQTVHANSRIAPCLLSFSSA